MTTLRNAVLLSISLVFSSAMADDAQDKATYERELSSVKALMMALQSDPKSGEASVKAVIDQISTRQKEAADLATAGEYELAKSILHEGYVQLTTTLASVKSGSGYSGGSSASSGMSGMSGMLGMVGSDGQPLALAKLKSDYARKLRSAESMQDAARRSNTGSGSEISAVDNLISKAKSAAKKEDFVAANEFIDEGLTRQKSLFAKSSSASPSPSASAGQPDPDDPTRDMTGMTGDDKKRAIASQLRTTKTLRDALDRKCKEKGNDCSGKLAEIDKKATEARDLESTDSTRSLLAADEAYAMAKSSLAAQRSGH